MWAVSVVFLIFFPLLAHAGPSHLEAPTEGAVPVNIVEPLLVAAGEGLPILSTGTFTVSRDFEKISSSFTVTGGTGFIVFSSTGTLSHISIAAPTSVTKYNWFMVDNVSP